MITSPFIPVKQDEFDRIRKGIEGGLAHKRTCFGRCDPVVEEWQSVRSAHRLIVFFVAMTSFSKREEAVDEVTEVVVGCGQG